MFALWFLAAAVAAPLTVEVVPVAPAPSAQRIPVPQRPFAVPGLTEDAPPVADGRLDEDVWKGAPRNHKWVASSVEAPEVALRWLVGPWGTAWAARGLGADQAVVVVFDPDGLQQRWVRLYEDRVELCVRGAHKGSDRVLAATKAVDCAPLAGATAVRRKGVWEAVVPGEDVGSVTGHARVQAVATGEAPASWAPWGQPMAKPELGRATGLPAPLASWSVVEEDGTWRVEVGLRKTRTEARTWTWRRYAAGRLLDEGTVTLDQAERGQWTCPTPSEERVLLELEAPAQAGWAPAAVHLWRRPRAEASLRTPVADPVAELAYGLDAPARWTVVATKGRRTKRVEVEVPAGEGVLRVGLPWREQTLAVEGVMAPVPVVRAAR